MSAAPLHATLAEVAEVCGVAVASALVEEYRGQMIYIPQAVQADHHLAQALGLDTARALAAAYGGDRIAVPMTLAATAAAEAEARRRMVLDLRRQGLPMRLIARHAGCSQRRAYQIVAAATAAADPRQGVLF